MHHSYVKDVVVWRCQGLITGACVEGKQSSLLNLPAFANKVLGCCGSFTG